MKTTLDLPDELMRTVKIRAVREVRKLKDMVAALLRRGLGEAPEEPGTVRARVRLPLVSCTHEARPDEEMTPERVAQVLIDYEADRSSAGRDRSGAYGVARSNVRERKTAMDARLTERRGQ